MRRVVYYSRRRFLGVTTVLYHDFVVSILGCRENGYSVSAVDHAQSHATGALPPSALSLQQQLVTLTRLTTGEASESLLRAAGVALFRYLFAGPIEIHLRSAWDSAVQSGKGLRLKLCVEDPEMAVWPWELLHDPVREHTFATSVSTPLVRFLGRPDSSGTLVVHSARLPLHLLLVVPRMPDLDLARERSLIGDSLGPLSDVLELDVLDGPVTRNSLADALLRRSYDMIHFSGHGGYLDGQGFLALNMPDGTLDWVDGQSLARICGEHNGLKLVVLNVCRSGQISDGSGLRGLTPDLVRSGVPAVVALQDALSDRAAATFAREFYRQLCIGENAGQVDVAVNYGRNMLRFLQPGDRSFSIPALYTSAPNGLIFTLPDGEAGRVAIDPSAQNARMMMFMRSLDRTAEFVDDWDLADAHQLELWRAVLKQAEAAYALHVAGAHSAEETKAARGGLAQVQGRLSALLVAGRAASSLEGSPTELR